MRKAFTLVEMLVVVVVMTTLMTIMFKLSGIGGESTARTTTVARLQKLENCLSGYYAAFGSYPPVKLHGARDPFLEVNSHGVQKDSKSENIFSWSEIGENAEYAAWRQVEAACLAQPVACNFPFASGYRDLIRSISEQQKELASSQQEGYESLWKNDATREKFMAGYNEGDPSVFTDRDKTDWRNIQVFRFGLMSFLLPRYLVMMGGDRQFYQTGQFAQWEDNNELPCDPFTGNQFTDWQQIKDDYAESDNASDIARLANVPSQAVCARWMPNLAGICRGNGTVNALFGIDIFTGDASALNVENASMPIYSPGGADSEGYKDQYILDSVTVQDGWYRDFYYYSPAPYQKYTLWSAGPNGRTFPPWISRRKLSSKANECVGKWIADDIVQMTN